MPGGSGRRRRAQGDQQLLERIRQIHRRSRATYGSPRVQAELRATGQRCSRRRVARLMRQAGLRGVHGQRRRVRTAVPDPAAPRAPDRVERAFAPAQIGAPDRLWLADISYVATLEGWLLCWPVSLSETRSWHSRVMSAGKSRRMS
jgi:putative transposase